VVSLSTGTRLGLHRAGELELLALGPIQRFALRTGRLRASVARLAAGQRFLIATDDAEVEVKGTSFEVTVLPRAACGARTRVRVFEGMVTVRSDQYELHVPAGVSWPPDCERPAPPRRIQARL